MLWIIPGKSKMLLYLWTIGSLHIVDFCICRLYVFVDCYNEHLICGKGN